MQYSVEIQIRRREIEQLGEREAVERATLYAWNHTIQETRPKRSVALTATEIDEYLPPGPHVYRYRFTFEVD